MDKKNYRFIPAIFLILLFLLLLVGCGSSPIAPAITPIAPTITPTATEDTAGLSEDAVTTLESVEQVDAHPLFVMHYQGGYDQTLVGDPPVTIPDLKQACSLFAALGDLEGLLYGRNFDWGGSPALLLFTDPPDGYASVSMVDIDYTTVDSMAARHPTDLPLKDRQFLLSAPFVPIDGMNEYGLVIGMASVSYSTGGDDPNKPTISSLAIMREILDHARTTDEAVAIFSNYNIDFTGGPPIHYLVADRTGKAILVEYYQGEMYTLANKDPWHIATNYLRCTPSGDGGCLRFNAIHERLIETGGILNPAESMELLSVVSQPNTEWSIVYGMISGEINIVMGTHYETVHTYNLDMADK